MSAVISECTKYRYWLERDIGPNPLAFVMLNPSTADAEIDDPTIRRCRRFASDNGYTGIIVVNLYAFRATKPKDLFLAPDPIGHDNDRYLSTAAVTSNICCAWGANANPVRAAEVVRIIQAAGRIPLCLGTTKNGSPRHPLYVKADQTLINYKTGY